MPRSSPTPCRAPGCAAVVAVPGYCPKHRGVRHREYGRARHRFDAEVGFYQSRRWRVMRASFLYQHPLCMTCERVGRLIAAKVVDHIIPIKQGGARFEAANLQSLCVRCHNGKTATERAARQASRIGCS